METDIIKKDMFFDKKFICLSPLLVYNIREININKPAREKARAQNKLNTTRTRTERKSSGTERDLNETNENQAETNET